MGQWPAAALQFRRGDVADAEGEGGFGDEGVYEG